ncbi:MAG: YCF48-related protein [Candidatus Acidiferrum sp.]
MPSDDRDQQLERALARHLRDASPDLGCPDAEILAALHERTLVLDEMARWKEHIVSCTRCQETLALLGETESVEDALLNEQERQEPVLLQEALRKAISPRGANAVHAVSNSVEAGDVPAGSKRGSPMPVRRQALRWLLPIGAIAAAALVWVGVHERQNVAEKHAERQVAENRPEPAPIPEQRPPSQSMKEKAAPDSPVVQPYSDVPAKLPAPSLQKSAPVAPLGSAGQSLDAKREENKEAAKASKETQNGDSLKGAESNRLATVQSGAEIAAESAPAPALAPPPAAAPARRDHAAVGGAAALSAMPQTEMRQKKSADTRNALASSMNRTVDSAFSLRNVASSDRSVIVAPGDQQAWIVEGAGKVLNSSDGGKTWTPQNTGVTADLSTGSAPSPSVAWIVGKSGTILLSVDAGAHWKQLTSPITGDLGGVHAVDALHAIIWDEGNRKSYSTSDGGATWTPVANE